MHGSNGLARSKPNMWVALAGAALVIALALGLLLGGGASAQRQGGYGGGGETGNGNPVANCGGQGGYGAPCPAEVSDLSSDPAKPVRGKGFKVKFSSKSGGAYRVDVVRNSKTTPLEEGGTGAGKTSTKKVGKKLKAGKYRLRVKVVSGARGAASDSAKKTLVIRKP
jgi:hypothetical protein